MLTMDTKSINYGFCDINTKLFLLYELQSKSQVKNQVKHESDAKQKGEIWKDL